jgi:hypothetical protein
MFRLAMTLRIVLGLFFLLSGIFKILSPELFILAVSRVLPEAWLRVFVVVSLPVFEVCLGTAVLFAWRLGVVLPVLLFALTGGTLFLHLSDALRDAPCGCFGGVIESTVSSGLYFRNIALAVLLLVLQMMYGSYNPTMEPHTTERL